MADHNRVDRYKRTVGHLKEQDTKLSYSRQNRCNDVFYDFVKRNKLYSHVVDFELRNRKMLKIYYLYDRIAVLPQGNATVIIFKTKVPLRNMIKFVGEDYLKLTTDFVKWYDLRDTKDFIFDACLENQDEMKEYFRHNKMRSFE